MPTCPPFAFTEAKPGGHCVSHPSSWHERLPGPGSWGQNAVISGLERKRSLSLGRGVSTAAPGAQEVALSGQLRLRGLGVGARGEVSSSGKKGIPEETAL